MKEVPSFLNSRFNLRSMNIKQSQLLDAASVLKGVVHKTPVLSSTFLNALTEAKLHFKCENFQKVGAFKFRGASYAINQLGDEEKANGVTTHSSGNHGQALAKAAADAGIKAYIVMPENAPKVKIDAVKGYGAEVSLCPPTLASREEFMQRIIDETGATPIHPYNHPHVILGQSTCAQEFLKQVGHLDILIAPVGGGGLLSGTLLAVKHFAPDVKVVAGEPTGADDAYQSWKAGKLIPQTNPNTIADGLLTSLGDLTYPIIMEQVEEIIRVEDRTILKAMKLIWERMKIIIEPSCAVPLAVILENKEKFKGKQVGLILTGGNVDLKKALSLIA